MHRRSYEFGPFTLDPDRRVLVNHGRVLPLTSKAFETLLVLVENHFRVVEKDDLLKLIWPDTVVEENNLAVNISTVRKALGEAPGGREYIVTVPGKGYRFVAPVRETGSAASRETPAAEPGPIKRSGWKRLPAVAAILAAATAGIAIVPSLRNVRRGPMRFRSVTNAAGVETQPAFSPDGRSVAFVSNRAGQYDIYVALLSGGAAVRVTDDSNVKARPRWSPDGSKLIYARLNEWGLWDVWAIPALGGTAHKLLDNATEADWSPEGRTLVFTSLDTGGISIADAATLQKRPLTAPGTEFRDRLPSFSRDGSRIAFIHRMSLGGPYGQLAVIDVKGGEPRLLTDGAEFVGSPAWSADGQSLYFSSGRGGAVNVWKVDARGGQPRQVTVGQGDDADLDVSRDGARLLFASYRANINLAEMTLGSDGSPRRWITSDAVRGEIAPVWSPDGKRVAYFTNRRGAENESIWVVDEDGKNPRQLVSDDRVNVYPRWSADGQALIYGSRSGGRVFYSDVELRRIGLSGGLPEKVAFPISDYIGDVSRQDNLLYRGANRSAQIFDLRTRQLRNLKDIQGAQFRWSPDGSRFATVVNPRRRDDPAAGVWIYEPDGARRLVYHGWAAGAAWTAPNELVVLEGKPDLNAIFWRVALDRPAPLREGSVPLIYSYWHVVLLTRFDVHPNARRIVYEAFEHHQAHIGELENIP